MADIGGNIIIEAQSSAFARQGNTVTGRGYRFYNDPVYGGGGAGVVNSIMRAIESVMPSDQTIGAMDAGLTRILGIDPTYLPMREVLNEVGSISSSDFAGKEELEDFIEENAAGIQNTPMYQNLAALYDRAANDTFNSVINRPEVIRGGIPQASYLVAEKLEALARERYRETVQLYMQYKPLQLEAIKVLATIPNTIYQTKLRAQEQAASVYISSLNAINGAAGAASDGKRAAAPLLQLGAEVFGAPIQETTEHLEGAGFQGSKAADTFGIPLVR